MTCVESSGVLFHKDMLANVKDYREGQNRMFPVECQHSELSFEFPREVDERMLNCCCWCVCVVFVLLNIQYSLVIVLCFSSQFTVHNIKMHFYLFIWAIKLALSIVLLSSAL